MFINPSIQRERAAEVKYLEEVRREKLVDKIKEEIKDDYEKLLPAFQKFIMSTEHDDETVKLLAIMLEFAANRSIAKRYEPINMLVEKAIEQEAERLADEDIA